MTLGILIVITCLAKKNKYTILADSQLGHGGILIALNYWLLGTKLRKRQKFADLFKTQNL